VPTAIDISSVNTSDDLKSNLSGAPCGAQRDSKIETVLAERLLQRAIERGELPPDGDLSIRARHDEREVRPH
jgi:hypothetical protein